MANAALLVGLVLLAALFLFLVSVKRRGGARRNLSKPGTSGDARTSAPRGGVFEVGEKDAVDRDPSEAGVPDALQAFHLRRIDELDDAERDTVEAICRAMPEPHPVQARLASGLDSPEELKEAVASDAGLTASVLRTVNSAAFSLASPITSVQHAITYLGVSAVKGVVLQAAVTERTPEGTPAQQAALARVWRAARVSSAIAQVIGQELGVSRPSVAATGALFANLGDVAIVSQRANLASHFGEGSTLLARIDAQQTALGANTYIVGSVLARHWDLPAALVTSIEEAGLPLSTPPARHPLAGDALRANLIVYAACRVGDAVAYGELRNVEALVLEDSEEAELYFLDVYLRSVGLGRLLGLFEEPGFRRKANRLIATLAS